MSLSEEPKVRSMPAWGVVPGMGPIGGRELKARPVRPYTNLWSSLSLFVLLFTFGRSLLFAQAVLTPQQIAKAEALGRNTDIPLKLGTLVHAKDGNGFQAFITTPEQRVAYAKSDMTSRSHGSLAKDPLADELHLNRLRVTGLPFPNAGADQHNSRRVVLCNAIGSSCVSPAHQILDANQVVAEFEMPRVVALSGSTGMFLLRMETDNGKTEPDVLVSLRSLRKVK